MSRVLLRAAVSAVVLSAGDARKVKPDGQALLSTATDLDSRSRLREQATAAANDAVKEAEAELAKEMSAAKPEEDKKDEKVVKKKVAQADEDGDDKDAKADDEKEGDDEEDTPEKDGTDDTALEKDKNDKKKGAAKKDETKQTAAKGSKKEAAKKDDKQKDSTKAPKKDDKKKETTKAAKKEEKKEETAKVSKDDDKKKDTSKTAKKESKKEETAKVSKENDRKNTTSKAEKPSMPKIGDPKCPCIGFAGTTGNLTVSLGKNKTALYPAEAFASCAAWDDDSNPVCKKGGDGTAWCKQPWCVVDPCNCEIDIAPKKATGGYWPDGDFQGMGGYWYSYATCGGKDIWADEATQKKTAAEPKECDKKVDEKMWGDSACQCIGVAGRQGVVDVKISEKETFSYPMDAGSTCRAWDMTNHPDCQGKDPLDWCDQVWCYVDPCSCAIAVSPKVSNYMKNATYSGRPVYYSYHTCGGNDTYTESQEDACVNQVSEEACATQSSCAWDGQQCLGKELVKVCKETTKKEKSNTQAETQNKTDEKAQVTKQPIAKFGTSKCPCVGLEGVNGELTVSLGKNETASYPAEAFSSCAAWDSDSNPACENAKDGDHWCNQAWCVVDPCNCELDIAPKKATGGYFPDGDLQGMGGYWYSYATCGAKDVWADEATQKKTAAEPKECDKKVDETKWGDEACQCIGVAGRVGNVAVKISEKETVSYPIDAGATCKAWDMKTHPDCLGDDPADWCNQVWCYVDPCSCAIAVSPKVSNYMKNATYSGRPVYYSYHTCGGNDTYTESQDNACVNQESEEECGNQSRCAWDGQQCLGKELVKVCKKAAKDVKKEERAEAKKAAKDTQEKSGALLPAAPFLAAFLAFVAGSS